MHQFVGFCINGDHSVVLVARKTTWNRPWPSPGVGNSWSRSPPCTCIVHHEPVSAKSRGEAGPRGDAFSQGHHTSKAQGASLNHFLGTLPGRYAWLMLIMLRYQLHCSMHGEHMADLILNSNANATFQGGISQFKLYGRMYFKVTSMSWKC